MPKETEQDKRDRKAKEARDRRRLRGLKRGDGGGAGKGQGRKIAAIPDRPTCCDWPMWSHGAKYWRCRVCGISQRKNIKENDDD